MREQGGWKGGMKERKVLRSMVLYQKFHGAQESVCF